MFTEGQYNKIIKIQAESLVTAQFFILNYTMFDNCVIVT